MGQDRSAPAYQEYPADVLSRIPFRLMSLSARGLFITMRYECWVNQRLPKNPNDLARILGLSPSEVSDLLPFVMAFFQVDGEQIFCPELERYRQHLNDRRERQSQGGKRSSEVRNGKRNTSASRTDKGVPSTLPSTLKAPSQGSGKFLVEQSKAEQSKAEQNPSLSKTSLPDDFVSAYESAEAESASAYLKASQGF